MRRFNATAYFILPLIGEGFRPLYFGEVHFNNAYISEDHKSVIVDVYDITQPNRTNDSNYVREWYFNHTWFVEYEIPMSFLPDVELILKGKYSLISDAAKQSIKAAIEFVQIEEMATDKIVQELSRRIKYWPHMIAYRTSDGKMIVSDIYIAITAAQSLLRQEYKEKLELELGCPIPDDIDLFEDPDMQKETSTKWAYKAAKNYN
ncbi:MAG: hypothetical protein PF450_10255 [Bacteroidales bacterium]|jgi:hypothetical protein|nr:hypothetical protein [Bacteroidales bacterium]